MTYHTFLRLFLCATVLSILQGCGGPGSISGDLKSILTLTPSPVWLEKVDFKIAPDANNNTPVAVHVLVIYKPELLAELSKMPAEKYFSNLSQLKSDNPNDIDFFEWEFVPGQKVEPKTVTPTRMSGLGVLVFARYGTPGNHRVAVKDDREITIELNRSDFKVVPGGT